MRPFPHVYEAGAAVRPGSDVLLQSPGVPALVTGLPAEFGGAGTLWSPETLFTGAIADCFALTFRGVATANSLHWTSMKCQVSATLERVDRVTRFTRVDIDACVRVPAAADLELARVVLERAEATCLVTNSLTAERRFEPCVELDAAAVPAVGM